MIFLIPNLASAKTMKDDDKSKALDCVGIYMANYFLPSGEKFEFKISCIFLIITLARKPESKNFDALASVIHQKNRIGSGFPGMCDFKSVHGA
mgnify:CR=1 FL=1